MRKSRARAASPSCDTGLGDDRNHDQSEVEQRRDLTAYLKSYLFVGTIALVTLALGIMNVRSEVSGKQDFNQLCARCHGKDGKRDQEHYLIPEVRAPDLTKLTRRNGGVFPRDRVYQSIDGRAGIPSHNASTCPSG